MSKIKQKISDTFKELGIPVPETMQEEKEISKADQKLIHIGVQHLYMGVLHHLDATHDHLMKLSNKGDERATVALPVIENLTTEVEDFIDNFLALKVEEMPTTTELTELMIKLQKEFENATLLKIMDANNDIPKEKMH